MQIRMSWPNTKEWVADMDHFHRDLSLNVMKDAAAQIVTDFFVVEKKLFMTGGGTGQSGTWPQISEKYRQWKQKHGLGNFIMISKGLLFRSLTSQSSGNIRTVSKVGDTWKINIGSDVKSKDGFDYPLHWQKGGGIKGKVATRRTIDPTIKNIHEWMRIIQRHMVNSAQKWNKVIDKVTVNPPPTLERNWTI